MPTVLTSTNAFLGVNYPQHFSTLSVVRDYSFPGGLQPKSTGPTVLSWTNAFPGVAVPQHFSTLSVVQNYLYPGALQPTIVTAPSTFVPILVGGGYDSIVLNVRSVGF